MLHVKLLLEGCGVLASSRVSALDVTFHELTTLPPEWSAFPSATNISMRLIMEASMESLDEATAHLNSTLPSRFAAAPLPAKWWKARDIDVKPSSLTQTDIDEIPPQQQLKSNCKSTARVPQEPEVGKDSLRRCSAWLQNSKAAPLKS